MLMNSLRQATSSFLPGGAFVSRQKLAGRRLPLSQERNRRLELGKCEARS
jgi:hypothetical protein